jgi:type I restriction-modification system DNA methylase subunit
MPIYIKEDWIKYNKKELSISLINEQIKKINNEFNQFEEELGLLYSLRRDLILKGLIS